MRIIVRHIGHKIRVVKRSSVGKESCCIDWLDSRLHRNSAQRFSLRRVKVHLQFASDQLDDSPYNLQVDVSALLDQHVQRLVVNLLTI